MNSLVIYCNNPAVSASCQVHYGYFFSIYLFLCNLSKTVGFFCISDAMCVYVQVSLGGICSFAAVIKKCKCYHHGERCVGESLVDIPIHIAETAQ